MNLKKTNTVTQFYQLFSNNPCGKCSANTGCRSGNDKDLNDKIRSATASNRSSASKSC